MFTDRDVSVFAVVMLCHLFRLLNCLPCCDVLVGRYSSVRFR